MAARSNLTGTILVDSEADGVQQAVDAGVAGLLVELFSADGSTLIASTISSAAGLYDFTGIAPGPYLLRIAANPGASTQPVTLTAGATTTLDATVGATAASRNDASIAGTVFTDANGDGRMDGTDRGLGGIVVQLLDKSGAVVASTTTAAGGTYSFDGLAAGTYAERFVAPSGDGYSSPGGNTAPRPFSAAALITAADNLLTNGSFEQTTRSIQAGLTGGFYGWTESGDTTATPYGSGPGDGPEIQPTDASPGGRYGVTASPDTQDPAYSGTHAAYFVDDGAIETISQTISLVRGQVYEVGFDVDEPSVGAGNPGTFSLAASIDGQTVVGADSRGGVLVADQWTHFSGLYTAAASGTYTLSLTYESGAAGSTLASQDVLVDDVYVHAGQLTQSLTPTSQIDNQGTTALVTLTAGQTLDDESAGLMPPASRMQGTLFNDINDDGVEDGADQGVSGATVTLYRGGVLVGAAVTSASGAYGFTGLLAGSTYEVQFTAPRASVFSPIGSTGIGVDSTVNSNGTQWITLAPSGGTAIVDAGTHVAASITGLPASAGPIDFTACTPFAAASVNLPDPNASANITIMLTSTGGTGNMPTDADGMLSGAGLVHTGAGAYSLSASSPGALTSELRALVFTPLPDAAADPVIDRFDLDTTQAAATASAATSLSESACFLAGTRILTEHGEIEVERLARGDSVATLRDGAIVHVPVKWVGGRCLDAATVRRTAIRPIRIRAGSFCDGVPHRDLLVTPEHCILVEGRLVPARMLVNDRSIVEDHSIASFSFHHVELDTHGVLLAEGLTTESYLDTGNRAAFANAAIVSLHAGPVLDASHKSWTRHACAPLATDRETVEPIWRRLLARAAPDAAPEHDRGPALSDDPQLRVLLDDGSVAAARWAGEGRHLFQIPQGARPVRLLSRTAVPARSIGPFVDDRRRLGVQVRSVVFWCGLVDVVHRATDLDLDGWHAAEAGARWTDGAARLDLPRAGAAETFVEIHVVGSMRYEEHAPSLLLAA